MRKMVSRLNDHIKVCDSAVNVKSKLQEEIEKAEEAEKAELNTILDQAKELLDRLTKHIDIMKSSIKKERAILENLRTLTLIKKVSAVLGGFLLFFGGVLLTFGLLVVLKILYIAPTESLQLFLGFLWLFTSIIMIFSGAIHQVV